MHRKGSSLCGYTSLLRQRAFIKMVIDRKGLFLVSTKFKHASYLFCDGHVFLFKLVEMLSGNTLIFPMDFDDFFTIRHIF